MIILKMRASFAKLADQSLYLTDGLNVIEGPNESGKSTWVSFLRAMLFGIDSKERDKKNYLAEKNRYRPWKGTPMSGSMDLLWNGQRITLRRTGDASAPFSKFQAVYTDTEDPVPNMTAENAGEMLTGVGRPVFDRTTFIGQDEMEVKNSSELEQRVNALITSGQEEISYSQAEQQLRDWRNARKSNRTGKIPKLEAEIRECSDRLNQMEKTRDRLTDSYYSGYALNLQYQEAVKRAEKRYAEIASKHRRNYEKAKEEYEFAKNTFEKKQDEARNLGNIPDTDTLKGLNEDCIYYNRIQDDIGDLKREIENMPAVPDSVEHPVFGGMNPKDALARASADEETVSRRSGGFLGMLISVIVLAAAAVAGLVFLLLDQGIHEFGILPVLICAAIAAASAISLLIFLWIHNQSEKVKTELLDLYGVSCGNDILSQAGDYTERCSELEQKARESAEQNDRLKKLETKAENILGQLTESVRSFAPEARDITGVSDALSRATDYENDLLESRRHLESAKKVFDALRAQGIPKDGPVSIDEIQDPELTSLQKQINENSYETARLTGELNAMGDPDVLEANLAQLQESLDRQIQELDALNIALESLKSANEQLHEMVSPELNKRVGELFCQLTRGRYSGVTLNNQFEAYVSLPDEINPHRLLELSGGTGDQLYLAIRLAMCEFLLPGADPPPLVLDDAFVRFDDQRLKLVLDYLADLARNRQVLLFTCQSRERDMLARIPDVPVSFLQISQDGCMISNGE